MGRRTPASPEGARLLLHAAIVMCCASLVRGACDSVPFVGIDWWDMGTDTGKAHVDVTEGQSLLFAWRGNHSVVKVDKSVFGTAAQCTGGTPMGTQSPLVIDAANLTVAGSPYYFVSQVVGECPKQKIEVRVFSCASHSDLAKSEVFFFFVAVVLIVSLVIAYLLRRFNFPYLPESGANILLGSLAGGILILSTTHGAKDTFQVPSSVFFYVLLPPIIFESGYTFHEKNFFSNLGSILLFAFVGTVISCAVVAGFIYGFCQIPGFAERPWSLYDSVIFGALISATDPVATLGVFQSLEADDTLYGLVFGESVMNDAVSIVLYRTLSRYEATTFSPVDIMPMLGMFIAISLGSCVVGVVTGWAFALVAKHSNLRAQPPLELLSVLITAYLCYLVSDLVHMSGIVSIFFFGVTVRHYAWSNMSNESHSSSLMLFRVLAELSETFVFIYLGVSLFPLDSTWEPWIIVIAILSCLVGRALNVFPLAALANMGRSVKITGRMQIMMFHAGLRGAVAYALAVGVDSPNRDAIRSTTQAVVLITVFLMGGSTAPLLSRMKLARGRMALKADKGQTGRRGEAASVYSLVPEFSTEGGENHHEDNPAPDEEAARRAAAVPDRRPWLIEKFVHLDKTYLIPFFSGGPARSSLHEANADGTPLDVRTTDGTPAQEGDAAAGPSTASVSATSLPRARANDETLPAREPKTLFRRGSSKGKSREKLEDADPLDMPPDEVDDDDDVALVRSYR